MDEKTKTWTLRFPAKENPTKYGEGIVRLANRVGCTMTSKQSIEWFLESSWAWSFFTWAFAYQQKATCVCIRSINQSNCSISVHLLFLFCSYVFISMSYENRSNRPIRLIQCCTQFKSPGDKILCVLYLHYNVAFTFKWYGNSLNKTFYSQRVWIGYNIELVE